MYPDQTTHMGRETNVSRDDTIRAMRTALVRGSDADLFEILEENMIDPSMHITRHGDTALHIASSEGRWEMVEMLIEYGADVFAVDVDGRMPVHIAAEYSHLDSHTTCMKILLNEMEK